MTLISHPGFTQISNALKFTQSGHVLLSVNVAENQLVFDVEDTGIGISPKFQRSVSL